MSVKDNWKAATGVASFFFFVGTITWCMLYGNPQNSLHVSAESWSFTGLIGILVSVGFSSVPEIIAQKLSQK